MKILSYIKKLPIYIRSLYFNIKYLPFYQAIKLPILVGRLNVNGGGKIILQSDSLYKGMIRLGFKMVGVYPDRGLTLENHGVIIFKGSAVIGNDCYISVGSKGRLELGYNFVSTAGLKLVCSKSIIFGENTLVGWDCKFMDTNFHQLYDLKAKRYKPACGSILIGENNWFATGCTVMHSVQTPAHASFGLNSVVTRNAPMKSYAVMGGSPLRVLTEGVDRINGKDTIPF